MTEFHIGQPVRFKRCFRGYGNAVVPISQELPDWLAAAVLADDPMNATVEGYDHDQEEDTDVVIVRVCCAGRKPFEQWVHCDAVAPV